MAERRQSILRDPRYPGGIGVALAWDYHVDGTLETSTILLRTGDTFVVQRSINDGTNDGKIREEIVPTDADAARVLYERLPIHFAPFPGVTSDHAKPELTAEDGSPI